jgi:hypothetical protein
MSDTTGRSEADLLELMRTARLVQSTRKAEQAAVDLEATEEPVPAVRIERVTRRRSRAVWLNDCALKSTRTCSNRSTGCLMRRPIGSSS